ncbi:MAG: alpha/beta hydrolase-fold protein [Saprospiraceae bacterium]|nr:alpha/beta hydrolase-fold protein [Saprospiraceae bacterium]
MDRTSALLSAAGVLMSISFASAQVTFRIVSLPSTTPPSPSIFISGDFEGWSGGDSPYQLQPGADSLFAITLPQMAGNILFKFTRGAWASVEKGPNGEEIANRVYTYGGNGDTVDITIHNWADLSGIPSTAAENVSVLDDAFWMPQLERSRRIWLYLPPGYDSTDTSFPVLYMHDGQNLFDDSTSFAGEWHVDETLNAMHAESGFGLIVVGIENGGGERINEYAPWIHPQFGGGDGEAYVSFITETLKPFVDSAFRTLPDPEFTGIMGSSMGGLISQYAGIEHPGTFGRVGIFSPSFALFDSCYHHTLSHTPPVSAKYYYLAGGLEGGQPPVAVATAQMVDTMEANGMPAEQMQLVVDPAGAHNEQFWSGEVGAAITWLFTEATVGSFHMEDHLLPLRVFPNPARGTVRIACPEAQTDVAVRVMERSGRLVMSGRLAPNETLDVSGLPAGLYFVEVQYGRFRQVVKVVID